MKHYCIMRHSNTLRQAIRLKMKRDNLTVQATCRELGITRPNFLAYLNGRDPRAIRQYTLLKFCEKIGIKVALTIELTD